MTERIPPAIDAGLLSPVTVGYDELTADTRFAACLIAAEIGLARAWAEVGIAPDDAVDALEAAITGIPSGAAPSSEPLTGASGSIDAGLELDLSRLIEDATSGGNPVIPLVGVLRASVPEVARPWVHRGATSQDILDTALMLFAGDAATVLLARLDALDDALTEFAEAHRDEVAAARTLTQHAVPTTVGLRAANWTRGVRRAADRLADTVEQLPAQLGGAGGTLASFAEIGGADAAESLPAAYAELLGLAAPEAPWHTQRWPVTELGDALAQTIDALGKIAADVATLSRTELGELAEGAAGGSSAMPQKRNPAGSVLIRSAAIRAPHLAATLHAAAALSVDERPDGAWHAEWPTLRELLRLALGAAGNAGRLIDALTVDGEAVRENLALTGGLIVSERVNIELAPILGAARVKELIAAAGAGEDLAALVRAEPGLEGIDADRLLDPAQYTGLAGRLVDELAADPEPRIEENR